MKKRPNNSGLVYSTEFGSLCPSCANPVTRCTCRQKKAIPSGDGIVRLHRETKGRKGKGVTLATGIPLADDALKTLAKSLKQKCGCGGSVKNGVIEIQGEHRDFLEGELKKLGYTVKRSGG